MDNHIEIVMQNTPEKFQPQAGEIVRPLLELLRKRNDLEREICARSLQLREEKKAKGISPNQTIPEEQELWEEYRRRYLELVEPHCLPDLLKYGASGSFGKPAQYDYIFEDPEAKVYFTMKTAKKAVVTTGCQAVTGTRYRFTLRPSEDGWKTGKVEYAFGSGEEWHTDHHV